MQEFFTKSIQDFHNVDINDIDLLTKREIEVLELLGIGLRAKEVADILHISVNTVTTHRNNIANQLDSKGVSMSYQMLLEHRLKKMQEKYNYCTC